MAISTVRAIDKMQPSEDEDRLGLGRLSLSWLDECTLTSLADERGGVAELTADLARALTSPDCDGARLRTLCRLIAIEKARLQMVQAMFGKALGEGRLTLARDLDRFTTTATKRLRLLIEEHRRECHPQADVPVVMVGQVGELSLSSKR